MAGDGPVRFRVAEGIALWHASDFGEKGYFEAGRVYEVESPKGLVEHVHHAIDAGALTKATKAELEEQDRADAAAEKAASAPEPEGGEG